MMEQHVPGLLQDSAIVERWRRRLPPPAAALLLQALPPPLLLALPQRPARRRRWRPRHWRPCAFAPGDPPPATGSRLRCRPLRGQRRPRRRR